MAPLHVHKQLDMSYTYLIHISLFLVVEVRLEQLEYSVSEDDGFVEGCVVLDGEIERNVQVELSTEDVTATGN